LSEEPLPQVSIKRYLLKRKMIPWDLKGKQLDTTHINGFDIEANSDEEDFRPSLASNTF
jgi:hypothetical protein